ncbi:EamA family transporter [Acidobacteriota bacterium]
MRYLYIVVTILFTVYAQIVMKWRMSLKGELPQDFINKILFLLNSFRDPWVVSCYFSGLIAALAWMAAMTKFDLSFAYPFISLTFVLVLIFSGILLGEPIGLKKIIGLLIIIAGLIVTAG